MRSDSNILTDDLLAEMDEIIQAANLLLAGLGLEAEALPAGIGRQDAMRLIDDKIARFPQHSISLKSARNAFAPISTLPTETMTRIFQNVMQPNDRGDFGNATWGEFMAIPQVCSAWRTVAQECPTLWARPIFPRNVEVASRIYGVMVQRAQNVPLSIRIPPSLGASVEYMNRCIWSWHLLEHLGEFHISIFDTSNINEFFHINYSQSTAPDLRSIIIGSPAQRVVHTIGTAPFNLAVPSLDILRIPLPRLELLDLTYCKIPWDLMDMRVWEYLTTVKLRCISQPPRKQFYDFLAKAPNLEVLELHTSLPAVSGSDERRRVILSKLVTCVVDGSPPAQCADFQECIEYPDTARVTILPA